MELELNKLPGNETIIEKLGEDDVRKEILQRYKDTKIVFSFAHEDWPFVEKIAEAMRIFFPQKDSFTIEHENAKDKIPNVFCYTKNGEAIKWIKEEPNESGRAYNIRNDCAATECYSQILNQSNLFVIFTYNDTIKYGPSDRTGAGRYQGEELNSWIHTNTDKKRFQYKIDLVRAHNRLEKRKFSKWKSPEFPEFSEFESYKVDSYGISSAQKTAEYLVRKILYQEQIFSDMPVSSIFSYEKDIIQFYQEIPFIIKNWLKDTNNEESELNILKLIAYIKQGIPPFWPSVARQSDFKMATENKFSNENCNEIGSPRIGIDMLWPTDSPQFNDLASKRQPDMVIAAALSKYYQSYGTSGENLSFPEAGPRTSIYAGRIDNVAILVSGGIAPGINAVIDGIVQRHKKYDKDINILGINNGFYALTNWNREFIKNLDPHETKVRVTEGGSILQTCRLKELLPSPQNTGNKDNIDQIKPVDTIVNNLYRERIKILYVIGGDGTMRASHQIAQACRKYEEKQNDDFRVSVVGIPKTMDNDILWVWQTFGFATAVEKAREIIEHLATEVKANPRVCVLQLFGSASGFVVSHAVLASPTGTCDFALIPEAEFSIDTLAWKLALSMIDKERNNHRFIPFGLVVMAESAIPVTDDCNKYKEKEEVGLTKKEKEELEKFLKFRIENPNCFPDGQISNDLRIAGLKLVSVGIHSRMKEIFSDEKLNKELSEKVSLKPLPAIKIDDDERFRIFTNEPRHLLRSVPPSFSDVIMGSRLGALAVDNAMAGYTDFMVSQWLTEYVLVPLDLVALGRKHIPQDGIFWKSVLAKTGQGDLR